MHLVITLGDPAGIGPQVVQNAARAYLREDAAVHLTLCGPRNVAAAVADFLREEHIAQNRVTVAGQADFLAPTGVPSAASGAAALAALHEGMQLVRQPGARRALVTAPISKHALALSGSAEVGHTDLLGRTLGQGPVAMAFFTARLQVVLCTVHLPLRRVFAALSSQRIVQAATLLHQALSRSAAGKAPHLAVAGLNPHAGEQGLLGDEEQTIVAPAIAEGCAQGLKLSGPHAPDTVFYRAAQGEFDGVVALYHDQGLIAVKMLSFGEAVNVTLGLSVVRTSPDHGTAFDRVGTNTASHAGMLAAMRWAHKLGSRSP